MHWDTLSFDCYGTLVDWVSGITRAFSDAAASDGIALAAEDVIAAYHELEPQVQSDTYRPYREVLGETALRVAARLGWPLAAERAGFLAESLPGWPVFADTRSALERLKPRYKLAILSNIDDDLLRATVERIGVEFEWTVTAQQLRSYKPGHAHFLAALERLDGDRGRLLHVAQSKFHDIRPCGELGIDCVWVNRQGEELDEGLEPLHVVKDLAELVEWLEADGSQ
ncbi:MAG: HAD-IA family hydrolase [Gemmatimonadota bacterium]|nr:MAG: HAD-IA family hydrolase [Gemmatimonadota bacterium]